MNLRLCIILSFVFVTAISLAPLRAKRLMHTIGPWHDSGHILVFFGAGTLVLFGARNVFARAFRTAAILLFCAAIELVQAITGHNRFEWRDIKTDAFGVFSAWAVAIGLQAFLENQNAKASRPAETLHQFSDLQVSSSTNRIEG